MSTVAVILIGVASAVGWAAVKIQRRKWFLGKLMPLMNEGIITKISFKWQRNKGSRVNIIPICNIEGNNWCLSIIDIDDDVKTEGDLPNVVIKGDLPIEVQILFSNLKAKKVIGLLSPNLWGIIYDQRRKISRKVTQAYEIRQAGNYSRPFGSLSLQERYKRT